MLRAVNTGSGDGAVTGLSSLPRVFRLPAAWCRCGIGLTGISLGLGPWDLSGRSNVPETPGDRRLFTGCPDATGHLKLANGPWRRNPAEHAEGHPAMAKTITSELVEAYSLCPRK